MSKKIKDSKDNFGSLYNDFIIGETYRHWPGKTITESDNNIFCLITMNHHPVHLDNHFAETQHHGKILVVGTLVFSLTVGLTVSDISGAAIANLSYENIKHINPVFIGDTLYAQTKILDKINTKSGRKGIVHVQTIGYNQSNDKVIEFERKILFGLSGEQKK